MWQSQRMSACIAVLCMVCPGYALSMASSQVSMTLSKVSKS